MKTSSKDIAKHISEQVDCASHYRHIEEAMGGVTALIGLAERFALDFLRKDKGFDVREFVEDCNFNEYAVERMIKRIHEELNLTP